MDICKTFRSKGDLLFFFFFGCGSPGGFVLFDDSKIQCPPTMWWFLSLARFGELLLLLLFFFFFFFFFFLLLLLLLLLDPCYVLDKFTIHDDCPTPRIPTKCLAKLPPHLRIVPLSHPPQTRPQNRARFTTDTVWVGNNEPNVGDPKLAKGIEKIMHQLGYFRDSQKIYEVHDLLHLGDVSKCHGPNIQWMIPNKVYRLVGNEWKVSNVEIHPHDSDFCSLPGEQKALLLLWVVFLVVDY